MASGGNEPVADEYSQGHSVFAFMLLKGLQEVDKDIFTTYELFHDYVWEQVAGRVSQTPQYSWLSNSGHEGNDFVFVRMKKINHLCCHALPPFRTLQCKAHRPPS